MKSCWRKFTKLLENVHMFKVKKKQRISHFPGATYRTPCNVVNNSTSLTIYTFSHRCFITSTIILTSPAHPLHLAIVSRTFSGTIFAYKTRWQTVTSVLEVLLHGNSGVALWMLGTLPNPTELYGLCWFKDVEFICFCFVFTWYPYWYYNVVVAMPLLIKSTI